MHSPCSLEWNVRLWQMLVVDWSHGNAILNFETLWTWERLTMDTICPTRVGFLHNCNDSQTSLGIRKNSTFDWKILRRQTSAWNIFVSSRKTYVWGIFMSTNIPEMLPHLWPTFLKTISVKCFKLNCRVKAATLCLGLRTFAFFSLKIFHASAFPRKNWRRLNIFNSTESVFKSVLNYSSYAKP